jgi:hypothetical protein
MALFLKFTPTNRIRYIHGGLMESGSVSVLE